MSAVVAELNERQREAVLHEAGPLLVLAGAGSGKTRVIVHRMAHLIRERAVQPWQLLAVTFTNKAAKQMQERLGALCPGTAIQEAWVGTFHALCHRLLRRHIEELGERTKDFLIYDADDQETLVKRILKNQGYLDKSYPPRQILSAISRRKTQGPSAPVPLHILDAVDEVQPRYEEALQKANALDFDDLLMVALRLLEQRPHVAEQYRRRFRHVLVDEYQDTNHPQCRLVKLLGADAESLCAVGDEDQSIYRWRGAEVGNILAFEQDFPGAVTIRLEQNYRSRKPILDAANALVAHNQQRLGKNLWTADKGGEPIATFEAYTDRQEVDWVLRQVQRHRENWALRGQAVLYRTNFQSRAFEEELLNRGIAYQVVGGLTFYERREVKDLLAYLRLAVNGADDVSFLRVVNTPARGVGKTSVEGLIEEARRDGVTLLDVARRRLGGGNARAAAGLRAFIELVDHTAALVDRVEPSELLEEVIESLKYEDYLMAQGELEGETRRENVRELVNALKQFTLFDGGGLREFLARHALESDQDQYEESTDRLTLMTVHAAKGLEFDAVYIVGLEEEFFPHTFSTDSLDSIEEERRLLYVGMTRARQRLHLTWSKGRFLRGFEQERQPSRFLSEIPATGLAAGEAPPPNRLQAQVADFLTRQGRADAARQIMARPSGPVAVGAPGAARKTRRAFAPGSRVKHSAYGIGYVVSREGDGEDMKLVVQFPHEGKKTLVQKFARLEPA